MLSRTTRRSRAALAALVPVALTVSVIATSATTTASASTPTYTVTTGTTGTYPYFDDSPFYPVIDSDGTFYTQSSHADYGGSQGRAWDFYTGTDVDTNLQAAAVSSSPANADTTTRCNTSPTGLMSTSDPAGSPTSGYAEPNYCDLIGMWIDPDTGNWDGIVHNEFTPSPFHDGMHYDSLDYAQSGDHGNTWTITAHIITSPYTTVRENDQLWTMASDGSIQVGAGYCLDVNHSGTTPGTTVDKYACNGTAAQTWTATGGALVNPNAGLCLTASGTGTGATFTLQTCTGAATQAFTTPATGAAGQIKVTGTPTMCVDGYLTLQLLACNDPSKDGRAQFPNQTYYFGGGDPRLFIDYASGYFYLYYDSDILNQAGGGRVIFPHVARAPISGKMAPSTWHKWYNGTWTQPGVGGKEAALVGVDTNNPTGYLDDAYNPANTGTTAQQVTAGTLPDNTKTAFLARNYVAYDAYLGMYISVPSASTAAANTNDIYGTSDLTTQKWVKLGTTTTPLGGYQSLVDGVSKTLNTVVGKTFRHYCMYSCVGTSNPEYTDTTIDSTSLPTPPVAAGTAYQIAAGDGQYLAQSGSALITTGSSSTAASQSWKFTATGDGFFTIANVGSGQNLGVNDAANSGRAWGAGLTVNTSSSVGYQWYLQSVKDANLPAGSYRLVNRYSGQALSLTSGTTGAVTAPQRGWANTGTSGDTHSVSAQTLTFPVGSGNVNTVTMTNPGTQQSTPGVAITPLQITATDSASGQTLTYSATGLPAGLSITSAGLITGTPTTTGTSTVTVTATDTTNARGFATFTWTVGKPNLIPAGNFESGNLSGWTVLNASIVTDSAAHSPTHDLQLTAPAGSYATMEYTVTGLSPNTTYTYTAWAREGAGATTSVGVKNFGGTQVSVHETATTWTQATDTFTTGASNTSATVFCYLTTASTTSSCDDLSVTAG